MEFYFSSRPEFFCGLPSFLKAVILPSPIGCHSSLYCSHSCRCTLPGLPSHLQDAILLQTAVILAGASFSGLSSHLRMSSFSGLHSFLQVHPSLDCHHTLGCHPSLDCTHSCRCILPGLPSYLQNVILLWNAVILVGASFLDCHHIYRMSSFSGMQTYLQVHPSWTAITSIGCHPSPDCSHSCSASFLDCHHTYRMSSFSGLQSFLLVHPSWTAVTPIGCHPSLDCSHSCKCIFPGLPSHLQDVILL